LIESQADNGLEESSEKIYTECDRYLVSSIIS